MRIFIALEAGGDFPESLVQGLLPLKNKYPQFRWIPKENLHVTLVFLGEVDEKLLPLIKEAMEETAGRGSIKVTGGKLFSLPHNKNANVLALGFREGGAEIASLTAKIRDNLKVRNLLPVGEEKKNFLPHITVARKGREPLLFGEDGLEIPVQGVFAGLGLYKSELMPQGARYTALASYPL